MPCTIALYYFNSGKKRTVLRSLVPSCWLKLGAVVMDEVSPAASALPGRDCTLMLSLARSCSTLMLSLARSCVWPVSGALCVRSLAGALWHALVVVAAPPVAVCPLPAASCTVVAEARGCRLFSAHLAVRYSSHKQVS